MGGSCGKPDRAPAPRPSRQVSETRASPVSPPRKKPSEHMKQQWTCPNAWCQEQMPLAQMMAHKDACDGGRPLRCFKCGMQIAERDLREHSQSCGPQACPDCGQIVLPRLIKYCSKNLCVESISLLGSSKLSLDRVRADPERREALAARIVQRAWRALCAAEGTSPLRAEGMQGSKIERVLVRWREHKRRRWVSVIFRNCWHFLDRWDERGLFTPRRSVLTKQTPPPAPGPRKRISQHFKGTNATDDGIDELLRYPNGGYAALAGGPPQEREDHLHAVREALIHSKLRAGYVASLVDEATAHLRKLPNVQLARLSTPTGMAAQSSMSTPQAAKCIIVGDIHGQLQDLNRILHDHQLPTATKLYVFNGDLVDRGANSCEVLFLVMCLMLAYPGSVFVNRGNHESHLCTAHYGFREEVIRKYSAALFTRCLELFQAMPLATLVCAPSDHAAKPIFVVHGGIPRHLWTLAEIDSIDRFGEMPEEPQTISEEVFVDLLWSDPECVHDVTGLWRPNDQRQAGIFWGPEMSRKFTDKNSLSCVVRSHAPPFAGWQRMHDGLVWTIFSASNYTGVDSNDGGVLVVTSSHGSDFHIVAQTWKVYQPLDQSEVPDSPHAVEQPAVVDAPASPVIVGPHRRFASELRRAVASWTKSAQDDVLRQLRERIFSSRHVLMAQFCDVDATGRGGVWKSEWVQSMSTLCEGWEGLPWFFLRRYLAQVDGTGAAGRVRFANFLHRHAVTLERNLFDNWLPHLLPWLRMRAATVAGPKVEWDKLLKGKEYLTYTEFFDLVTNTLDCSLHKDAVFLLYGAFDELRDGLCRKSEWVDLYDKHKGHGFVSGEQSWEDHAWQPLEARRHFLWDLWLLQRLRQHFSKLPTPLAAFRLMDDDGDGEIGEHDLKKCIQNMGVAGATYDVHQRQLDSTTADYRKRVRYVLGKKEDAAVVAKLFGVLESEVHIDARECTVQVWPLSDSQVRAFIERMDCNGDGKVTFEDFCKAVTVQDQRPDLLPAF